MSSPAAPPPGDVERLACLEDPTRRALYDHVVIRGEPVSREDAATALDIDRSLAAYHLDKLVDAGLLAPSFARPSGRGGPGAGRPAKHYARVEEELAVTVPPRDYRLAAELLARAATEDASGNVRRALDDTAAAMGREVAAAGDTDDLRHLLASRGYEPLDDNGVMRLRNCPFHRLSRDHTELVCGMNLSLLDGTCRALDAPMRAILDPAPGRCCVAFVPTGDRTS